MLRVCLSMLVLVILAGCGPPERSSLENGPDQALLDTVFTAFGPMQVMGAGTALVSGDSVVLVAGLGSAGGDRPYTSATVQNIGSISKTFIGVAIMKAVELGLVDLDAPIQHHLPFPVHHPHFPEVPITLRHLATHTSGIRDTEAAYHHQTYVLRVPPSDPSWNDWSPLHPLDPDDAVSMEQLLERALADHGEWRSDSSFTDHRPGTRFEYSNLQAATPMINSGDTLVVSVELANTGDFEAEEVAQLYIRDLVSSIVRPVRELKAFQRVRLKPGESRKLTFNLPVEQLAYYYPGTGWKVEPGQFRLWIGGDSNAELNTTFEVR